MSESHLTLPMATIPAGAVFSAVMAIQMKNFEALTAVQKAAMQGMSTLAKQQQVMLTAQLQGTASLPATLSMDTDPREAVAKPFDSLKSAILDGQAQSNLLNELVLRPLAVSSASCRTASSLRSTRRRPRCCWPYPLRPDAG